MTEKYTLIIAEKPQSAKRIAQSLADGKVQDNKTVDGVPFYAITRDGKSIMVAPAVGHLFGLKQSSKGWNYPVFDIHWEPIYFKKASAYTKKYFDNLQALAKDAEDFIIATDYDIEGDVIGINILKFICGKESAKRMKFSTLIKSDLEEAYTGVMQSMDFGQVNAGLARHTLDWYYGINITRALSLAMKSAGRFFILSTGRVQGPSLKILADREAEIKAFKPTPYWEMEMRLNVAGVEIVATHEKEKFWEKSDAEKILENCKGRKAKLTGIEKKKYNQKPPTPFDLTTLQSESYRWFGFTPMQTQNIAQSLYEAGLISYPRTSSQKIPEKLGYQAILKSLGKQKGYKALVDELLLKSELKPNEGEKSDPAHPAIYPTGEKPE
ncbi:MAG: DNA topoisomerase I, partial [Candidatus Aenigmatarchaeota archaeon]